MEEWLWFLRGPVFRFAVVVAVLGLTRELLLGIWGAANAYRRANDKNLPWGEMVRRIFGWTIPAATLSREFGVSARSAIKNDQGAGKVGAVTPVASEYLERGKETFIGNRKAHGVLSFILHLGVVIVPLLLLDHLLLWQHSLGFRLPALPQLLANFLTVVTILAAVGLIISRVASKVARRLTSWSDYALLVLIIVIFCSGYVASRPWNPLSWEGTMIIHVLAGNALLLMMPFTKLAHIVLYPVLKFSGELAWKFPARTGEEVALTLDEKEVRPI